VVSPYSRITSVIMDSEPTAEPTGEPTAEPTEPPTPTPTPQPVELPVNDEGVVQEDIEYRTTDGKINIFISSGTVAHTEEGEPLELIEIAVLCFDYPPPPLGAYIIGCAYDYKPDGATFAPPITITVTYAPGLIPPGVDEEDLVIAYYDVITGKWVVLPSTVDTVNNLIMAEVSGFTLFAAYAPAPEATPAPTATATPTPEEEEGVAGLWIIIGPVIAVILIALIVYLLLRRRKRYTFEPFEDVGPFEGFEEQKGFEELGESGEPEAPEELEVPGEPGETEETEKPEGSAE